MTVQRLTDLWNRHWFAPEQAINLAVARVLAAATALWVLLSRDRAGVSSLGEAFWDGVSALTRWRYLLFPGHETLEKLLVLLTALLLAGALAGIRPRTCALASGLLLYHLAPLESIVWNPAPAARGLTLPALALLVCGFAPSGDALVRGRRSAEAPSWRYGWPVRLIQWWLVSVYLFSGIAKLRDSGISWASAANLSHWLYFATQNELIAVHRGLGSWLAGQPLAAGAIGVGTLVFELGVIAALFSRRWRPWLAAAALLFHLGIYLSMNITLNSWPLLLVFFDWSQLRRHEVRTAPGIA